MSLARKQALVSGTAWLLVSVVFVVLVAATGIEAFASPAGERTRSLVATVILPGYLVNFGIMWWKRRGRRAGEIDERDKAVEHRATEITALVMLLVIFLLSIWLYDTHVEGGMVPVGWLFVMAYGSIALVSLLHPVATLLIDHFGRIDG